MNRLIQIDPEAKLCPEQEGYEFGYYAFEDMEPIKCEVQEIETTQPNDLIPLRPKEIRLPLRQKTNFAKKSVVNSNKSSCKVGTHIT